MKNHPARTGLDIDADAVRIDAELGAAGTGAPEAARREDLEAARTVLGDPGRATHYRRAHLHYRAMAAALDALDAPLATDSHRWRERLIEFEPEDTAPPPPR